MDPVIFAGAVVTVIAALGAAIVTVINAKAAADERAEARMAREVQLRLSRATDGKADAIIEKTVQIHEVTNSNLSKVTAALDVALSRIEGLQAMVRTLTEAKRIADALATAPPVTPKKEST